MMMMMITLQAPPAAAAAMAASFPGRDPPIPIPIPPRLGTARVGWKWDPHNHNCRNKKKKDEKRAGVGAPLRALLADSAPGSSFPLASRIIVTNLGYFATESSLLEEFSHFGQVAEVELIRKYEDGGVFRRAFAFVQYTNQNDAILALETMHGTELDGRLIRVDIAKPGSQYFGRYPKATGPPNKPPSKKQLQPEDDFSDCWY